MLLLQFSKLLLEHGVVVFQVLNLLEELWVQCAQFSSKGLVLLQRRL